jgi:hypothetical protein
MPDQPPLRDELVRAIQDAAYESDWSAQRHADAVLGALTTRIQQLPHGPMETGAHDMQGHFETVECVRWADVLAVLGVAPTTPETHDQVPHYVSPGHRRFINSLPTHDQEPCRVYWGSHGCRFPRGHSEPHECNCCKCVDHDRDHEANGCVAGPPYYGARTPFYGEDLVGFYPPWWTDVTTHDQEPEDICTCEMDDDGWHIIKRTPGCPLHDQEPTKSGVSPSTSPEPGAGERADKPRSTPEPWQRAADEFLAATEPCHEPGETPRSLPTHDQEQPR